jgi:hypothetical protein
VFKANAACGARAAIAVMARPEMMETIFITDSQVEIHRINAGWIAACRKINRLNTVKFIRGKHPRA